ncbi:MAG: peptidylprolyl isomerase [Nanoarchaeota archaeon]|nr:peptidylprolyl isomerase [Nanoarchaeota archaeon]
MSAKKGDTVTLDYEGKFEDGTIFDSSKHGDHSHPLTFVIGEGQVIPGFDKAVEGMKIDQEKEFKILPEDGYGDYNKELIKEIPRKVLPEDQIPEKGMTLIMSTPDGQQIPTVITEVDDKKIIIDLNHPLAGKKLIFKVKLLKVE